MVRNIHMVTIKKQKKPKFRRKIQGGKKTGDASMLRLRLSVAFILSVTLAFSINITARIYNPPQLFRKSKKNSSFFFVQIADPQLGILNGYSQNVEEALDWSKEKNLLELALSHVTRLKPSFLLLSGDMQQYYPKNQGNKNGVLANHIDAGYLQAEDVRSALMKFLPDSMPVRILPGNHDVDDVPNESTLDYFHETWNPDTNIDDNFLNLTADHYYSFWQDEVFFIVLNSQFYYDGSELPKNAKAKQTDWFRSQLEKVQQQQRQQQETNTDAAKLKNIVVLTHIAPFGGSPDENHGFGNWQVDDRDEVLAMATSFDRWPTLWLCAHLHGNGRYYGNPVVSTSGSDDGKENKMIEIVISNSVTSPMEWDGVPAKDTYSAEKMSEIISVRDAGDAFNKYIAPDFDRISGGPSKAGLRIVEFFYDGSYRHKWFSLDDIATVHEINDESMVGAIHVDNPWDTQRQK